MIRTYKETNSKTNKKTISLNEIKEELKEGDCCYIISHERKLNKNMTFLEV